MKSQLAEVQTGFEPLFFHIQADFQWQRPFSEGCGGWISEKSKKNLSQIYGRWIVGFDETMTSAFLRSKRALGLEVLDERRTYTAEGKISARGRTEAPAQGAGCKATGGRSDPRQMEWTAALLG
jgi:hypothetical protein